MVINGPVNEHCSSLLQRLAENKVVCMGSETYLMHWLQLGSFLSQPFLMLLQWEHTCGARCKP
jgi:hypothetical protein